MPTIHEGADLPTSQSGLDWQPHPIWRNLGPLLAVGLLSLWASLAEAGETGVGRYYTVAANGQGPLHLYVEEKGQGDPVVLLHGMGASTYEWRLMVPGLARRHRVLNIDLKGFGRSDKPADGRYGAIDQGALVKDFLVRNRIRNATLIGHSLGGGIALATTLSANQTDPGIVSRLVLIDSAAYPQELSESLTTLRDPVLGPVLLTILPPDVLAATALTGGGSYSKVTRDDIRAYARPYYDPAAKEALLETARQIVPPNFRRYTTAYPTIRQPALLIWCRADDVVPLSVGVRLSKDLPNARLEVLDGCLHVPIEEQPGVTGRLIRRFLDSH